MPPHAHGNQMGMGMGMMGIGMPVAPGQPGVSWSIPCLDGGMPAYSRHGILGFAEAMAAMLAQKQMQGHLLAFASKCRVAQKQMQGQMALAFSKDPEVQKIQAPLTERSTKVARAVVMSGVSRVSTEECEHMPRVWTTRITGELRAIARKLQALPCKKGTLFLFFFSSQESYMPCPAKKAHHPNHLPQAFFFVDLFFVDLFLLTFFLLTFFFDLFCRAVGAGEGDDRIRPTQRRA